MRPVDGAIGLHSRPLDYVDASQDALNPTTFESAAFRVRCRIRHHVPDVPRTFAYVRVSRDVRRQTDSVSANVPGKDHLLCVGSFIIARRYT